MSKKPLGRKAYGSIGHLPNSRLGPGDHKVPEGMAKIATEKLRDVHDTVVVQEKLDGSCVAVAKINGEVLALGRSGYLASTSPYEQHHMFDWWVRKHTALFGCLLEDGERIVGEWLAQAHGTKYDLQHYPFVAFDLMRDTRRETYATLIERIGGNLPLPALISYGLPIPVDVALKRAQKRNAHKAIDPIEGVIYRVERQGEVDFLAKYVRPDKEDGMYFPERTGGELVWNWRAWRRA